MPVLSSSLSDSLRRGPRLTPGGTGKAGVVLALVFELDDEAALFNPFVPGGPNPRYLKGGKKE